MQNLARGFAVTFLIAGLFVAVKPQITQPKGPTAASTVVPIPVCPPNDPNACHIDTWPE
jgi:hypothetical protein